MRYELSVAADQDLEAIFDYTEREFGVEQAAAYLRLIGERFDTLSENPELGRIRDEIRMDLRSLVVEKHIIFYRLRLDRVRIVRVLHGRQDVQRLRDE